MSVVTSFILTVCVGDGSDGKINEMNEFINSRARDSDT
jgi:hypothetical protein